MTIVALAILAALVLVVAAFGGALRSMQRAHARREDLLLNQLLHAVGKPWVQAPAEERPTPEPLREVSYTASPEALHFPNQPDAAEAS